MPSKQMPKARPTSKRPQAHKPVRAPRPPKEPVNPATGLTDAEATALWNESRVLVACNDFHGSVITQASDSFATFMFEAADLIAAGRIVIQKESNYMTDMARSKFALQAVHAPSGFTHLFMWDADMTVSLSDLTRLLARRVDVVSGTYFMRGVKTGKQHDPAHFPCVATLEGQYITREEIAAAAERDEMIVCDGLGGGCLLVTTECLRAIGSPAFTFEWELYAEASYRVGEDTTFCRRAIRCGFPCYMDPTVRPDHFAVVRSGYSLRDLNNHEIYTPQY